MPDEKDQYNWQTMTDNERLLFQKLTQLEIEVGKLTRRLEALECG